MKKPIALLLLFALLTTFGCKPQENKSLLATHLVVPENTFENTVYNFKYPDDWHITDNEKMDGGVHYIAIEKKGFDASGIMTIISFEELVDHDASIQMNFEELQNNPIFKNLQYESIKNSQFNGMNSRVLNFNFSVMGIKHEGEIMAFSSQQYSVVILKQEALEDHNSNKNGFEMIEKSFKVK